MESEEARSAIAVVDDDGAVLRSVSRLLSVHGFNVVTYSSAETLLADVESLSPGCIITDLSMPGLNGLDLQQTLVDAGLEFPMVFITGFGDIRTSVLAMRAGAVDFLGKPFEERELLDAVRRSLKRCRSLREHAYTLAMLRQRVRSLTPREREVFERVVDGRLNKQIAWELGITEKTVKVHRARVMQKMAVRSVAQLARCAEQITASA